MGAILIHITWGIFLQIQNWLARPVGYVSGNKSETSFFSRFMIWTGATVLTFLVLHFFNFYFIKLGLGSREILKIFIQLHIIFLRYLHTIIFIWHVLHCLGFTFIMLFLQHFQTLGLNHRIWTPVVKVVALIYAIVIPAGFAFISIIIMAFQINRKEKI